MVDGSLANGIEVRLDREASVEDVKVGAFVTIRGSGHQFFGVVTDVSLGSADPRLKHGSVDLADPFISQALSGTVAYGAASVLPNLIMPLALGDPEEAPAAAKTIPAHFSRAYAASERDVAAVFGEEDDRHFNIGSPLDMEAKVCLDLDQLVKRSIGVFGKSGTGKDLPHASPAGGYPAGQPGLVVDFRHAQRVRMGRPGLRRPAVHQGLEAAIPLPGRHLHPGRGKLPAQRLHYRRGRPHRLQ